MSQAALGRRLVIRSATAAELPACRILLPEVFGRDSAANFLLATSEDPLRFLGAAAFIAGRRRSDGRPSLNIALRVADPHRGQGIGTELLGRLEAAARRRCIDVLATTANLPRHRDWAEFLVERGFLPVQRLHTFEGDVQRPADYFASRRDSLVARGKVPEAASVVSVREAPARQIAELVAAQIGGLDDQVNSQLRNQADGTTDNLGFALLVEGEVQAVWLHRLEGNVATIDALAVAPSLQSGGARAGWANMFISARAFEYYAATGIRRARYVVSASNRMVMKQYLRFDPDEIEVQEAYERPLGPEKSASS